MSSTANPASARCSRSSSRIGASSSTTRSRRAGAPADASTFVFVTVPCIRHLQLDEDGRRTRNVKPSPHSCHVFSVLPTKTRRELQAQRQRLLRDRERYATDCVPPHCLPDRRSASYR